MTSALRICVAAARRLRRTRQAFVVSLGVILLVYVILANDVFREYKPNAGDGSVELMKMNDPGSSTRPAINFDDLPDFETKKSLNSQTSTQSQQAFFDQSPNFNTSKRSKDDDPALLRSGNNSIFSKDRSNISSNWKDRPNISGNTRLGIRENRKSNNGTEQGFQIVVRSQQTGTGNLNSSKGQNAQGPSSVLESDRPMTGMGDNSRSSVLLAGVPRSHKVFLTIGMVTVKRDKADYFFTTVASLLEHSSQADQRDITIVVMLADRNQSHNDHVLEQLKDRYPTELESGLLLVIRGPNSDFIFEKADLKRTYQDSLQRVQWRSKQNIDYAALIDFCTPLSAYYLHIEDDVLSADDYVTHIRDFIKENEKILWAMIEVCPHGFIGKLFKNVDLSKLVIILRSFYLEQPCDFLIGYFMKMMTQNKHILRKGALFFHQGKFSSLFNVTRKTDKPPKIDTLKLPVVKVPRQTGNPAAKVFSDLVSYQDHVVENAYDLMSDKFLWALDVKEGQRYTVVFTKAERLKRLVIETGFSEETPRDRLDNAAVEMGTRAPEAEGSVVCPEAKTVGTFQKGHLDVTLAPPHDIKCISVVIKATQKEWLVIREIVVTTG